MYIWSVFIHLVFVTFWLGGMLFTAAVLVPSTREKLKERRGHLFMVLGTRFSRISWVIFPLLFVTGILALLGKGISVQALLSYDFWTGSYGGTLRRKLELFGLVMIISGTHDLWLGPKASKLMDSQPDTRKTQRYIKASSWAGRINLLIGLAILYLAVTLVRGW